MKTNEFIIRESLNESAGWIAMWNGKKCEIKKDEAKDLWGAKQLAIKKLGVPKSKVGELALDVAFEDDEEGTSNAQFEDLKEEKDVEVDDVEFIDEVPQEEVEEEVKTIKVPHEVTKTAYDKKQVERIYYIQNTDGRYIKNDYYIDFCDKIEDAEKYQTRADARAAIDKMKHSRFWKEFDRGDKPQLKVVYVDRDVEESLKEEKDVEVKDVEKMAELEPGDEVEVTKEMDDVFDKSLEMTKEFGEEPKLETFDEQMDFLAKDEQEAIDGYDEVIAMLDAEADAHVIEQLVKIKTEEIAHKEFLEKVKEDHELEYTEPLPVEEPKEVEVDAEEIIDEVPEEEVEKSLTEAVESKGEKIAQVIADTFKGKCGPFGGEDPELNGNEVTFWSQGGNETWKFNDDGSIDSMDDFEDIISDETRWDDWGFESEEEGREYFESIAHFNSIRDLINSGLSWFNYIPNEEEMLKKIDAILRNNESLEEDTVKQGNHWVNKGDDGTHGKFKTKKEADAQRKAMFANGYHEDYDDDFGFNHILDEEHEEEAIDWDCLDDECEVKEEKHVCEKCDKEVCECDKLQEEDKPHTGHIKAKKPIELKARIEK